MTLNIYADRMSQPSRAIIIFCKANGIEFEENKVEIFKREHKKPEYLEINPMGQVPSIAHGEFKLFESHAILSYLACAFPGVADNWYPADLRKRAKINSVLDWHHSNLRRGAGGVNSNFCIYIPVFTSYDKHHAVLNNVSLGMSCKSALACTTYVLHTVLAPFLGLPQNPIEAAEAEKLFTSSLLKLESIWLKGEGNFLLGGSRPSIADISLVCEIMEFELLDENDCKRLLSPHKKVLQWIEDTRIATSPHFDEVHAVLFKAKARFSKQSTGANNEAGSSIKAMLSSTL
ncbi:hypothetical protein IFM89_006646 [Coptis chinensis]|uniref:Glutathione S-transferase n=1 Tax=Coptis chinensis TaxID=261450 RepID=A0A835MEA8_9MAGN|nr:hypothetical protein IFM89_006646 [Coptis chinensis]